MTLSLPECEGDTPEQAVEDFILQAHQSHLWNYTVEEEGGGRGRTYTVDMADSKTTDVTYAKPDIAAITAEVRSALEGDSNDAEHDALVSVAEFLGITYGDPA